MKNKANLLAKYLEDNTPHPLDVVEALSAAQVLHNWIWEGNTINKFKISNEGNISIEQQDLLEYLMKFQRFLITEQALQDLPPPTVDEVISETEKIIGRKLTDK